MHRPTSRIRPTSGWIWRLAATLAVLAQCWIAVAPLSESRGFGLSAHVEALGNHRGHYTHDAATCPACTVLSLRALSSQPAVVPEAPEHPVFRMIVAAAAWLPASVVYTSQPRAPPAVV